MEEIIFKVFPVKGELIGGVVILRVFLIIGE